MSKFILDLTQYLEAVQKEKVAFLNPCLEIDSKFEESKSFNSSAPIGFIYNIFIKLGQRVCIKDISELPAAKKQVKREIVHHLFGEFREKFFELDREIRMGNRETALDRLSQIERSMFDV